MTVLVDGMIEIKVSFPQAANQQMTTKTIFIKSELNEVTRVFNLGYDPGMGSADGAMWTYMVAGILRVDRQDGSQHPVGIEEIMQTLYTPEAGKKSKYTPGGTEVFGHEEWLKVNYIGDYPTAGAIYYKPIADNYALMMRFEVFGENSDQTKLYAQRYEDLKKAIRSVKVTVADFAREED